VDTARLVTALILNSAIDLYGEGRIVFNTDMPFVMM
jgi:hypothetical protein